MTDLISIIRAVAAINNVAQASPLSDKAQEEAFQKMIKSTAQQPAKVEEQAPVIASLNLLKNTTAATTNVSIIAAVAGQGATLVNKLTSLG
ncbi:hypothetical protein Rin_00001770 [Candidatus Regiella insecticola 5.15]|uniref:Uncharacterized protein n=1 Tax=Candidatus Regiella insecticola 5.15 TaxID=1005043 RepID=G2GWP2_9ENTR|nr:hypothetical protein [Candidatus Regiella insecticola]EGY29854.1 hypothetical protein Rin_00001770 [Candidatus Regiella insecticola 5.15]